MVCLYPISFQTRSLIILFQLDFVESLPQIEKPRQGKVRDGYDAEGVKTLETQGAKILSALQFKADTPDRVSVASKFALKVRYYF